MNFYANAELKSISCTEFLGECIDRGEETIVIGRRKDEEYGNICGTGRNDKP